MMIKAIFRVGGKVNLIAVNFITRKDSENHQAKGARTKNPTGQFNVPYISMQNIPSLLAPYFLHLVHGTFCRPRGGPPAQTEIATYPRRRRYVL
jgi:hypothetical protein